MLETFFDKISLRSFPCPKLKVESWKLFLDESVSDLCESDPNPLWNWGPTVWGPTGWGPTGSGNGFRICWYHSPGPTNAYAGIMVYRYTQLAEWVSVWGLRVNVRKAYLGLPNTYNICPQLWNDNNNAHPCLLCCCIVFVCLVRLVVTYRGWTKRKHNKQIKTI